jgi:hypothetical protein
MRIAILRFVTCTALLAMFAPGPALAADHDDTPLLKTIPRHEARLSDLHVFVHDAHLVLTLCTNPAIPSGVTEYQFPSDLTLRLHLDNHSAVSFDDTDDLATWGGTILDPAHVGADVTFEVTFDEEGTPRLETSGVNGRYRDDIELFAGLRDDPFIRGPRLGRNVAAVCVSVPLEAVLGDTPTLLAWATSKVPDVHGPISEHAGRALRSQFAENLGLNAMRPRRHFTVLDTVPDVVILDTTQPCAFPNGRTLEDDVVDMVGDPRVTSTDAPFPSTNDVPFLDEFPFLAPPQ